LSAELSKIKIRASLIAGIHRLAELPLGVVSVEYDTIDDDGESFYNDFDDAANQGPGLKRGISNRTLVSPGEHTWSLQTSA
jgi:hypothetical protein